MDEIKDELEPVKEAERSSAAHVVGDEQLVAMLVDRARSEGLQLTGEGGLLQQLTKRVLESALEGEITDHLGYDKHDPAGKNSGNSRNGTRSKTVLTDVGPVEVKRAPRRRAGTFEPQIVKKRQRRLTGVDEMVLSLSAKGLTHGEISAHLAEVYGAEVSKQTISTITDKVMEGMAEWQNRPLDPRLSGGLHRRHQREDPRRAGRQPADLRGHGRHRRGAPRHPRHLGRRRRRGRQALAAGAHRAQEPRRRRRADARLRRAQGPARTRSETVWPRTIVQTCVVHLLRNSFRYAARQDWDKIAKALKPVYTAPTEDAATERFLEFSETWGKKYPAIVQLWENAWAEFVPFLAFDVGDPQGHLLDERHRVRERPHPQGRPGPRPLPERDRPPSSASTWPLMTSTPPARAARRWTMRWKAPLNAFQIAFEGRLTPTNH